MSITDISGSAWFGIITAIVAMLALIVLAALEDYYSKQYREEKYRQERKRARKGFHEKEGSK